MEEQLLSKKELLQITGISYGQLYRWKRQNLIPESWFIKQSSFTGQETFFPKEKILNRVKQITSLKDQYSLEELAELFSPGSTNKMYQAAELLTIPGFNEPVIGKFKKIFDKESFVFRELLFIYVLSKLKSHTFLEENDLGDMVASINAWLPSLKNLSYRFVVCQRQSQTFSLMLQQDAPLYLDHKISELHVYELDEMAKELNLKLNQVWEENQ